jgi:tetratricopeptide (TPR) repeat protein
VPEIREEVAASLDEKADVLMNVGLYSPALDTILRLQDEFAGDSDPQIREFVADSLLTQARLLTYLERDADAQAAIDAYCDRYWDEVLPERHVSVLEIKGTIRLEAGRANEALSFYDQALSIPVGDGVDVPVLALAKHQRAKALEQLGRVGEARSGYQRVLREHASDTRASVKEIVGRSEAALSKLDR